MKANGSDAVMACRSLFSLFQMTRSSLPRGGVSMGLLLCMPLGVRAICRARRHVESRRGSVLDLNPCVHDRMSPPQAIWALTSTQGRIGA